VAVRRGYRPSIVSLTVILVAVPSLLVLPPEPLDYLPLWASATGPPKIHAFEDALIVQKPEPGVPVNLTGLNLTIIQDYSLYAAVLGPQEVATEIRARGYTVEPFGFVKLAGRGAFRYDYTLGPSDVPPGLQLEWGGLEATYPFYVTYLARFLSEWHDELRDLGVVVHAPAEGPRFLVTMRAGILSRVMSLRYIAWVEPYHYAYRAAGETWDIAFGRVPPPENPLLLSVNLLPGASIRDFVRFVPRVGGYVEYVDFAYPDFSTVRVTVPSIWRIVHSPYIEWLEVIHPGLVGPEARESRSFAPVAQMLK
jgi:hypothetical protein